MSLVGPNGQPISGHVSSIPYEVCGIQIRCPDTPESLLKKALAGAQQMMGQAAAQAAFARAQSHMVAQAEGQAAAASVQNPFQLEPCALSMFMLMSRVIEHQDQTISALAKRLDALDGADSKDILKKPWSKASVFEAKDNSSNPQSDDAKTEN